MSNAPVIYCIENLRDGKVYIGSTIKFRSRTATHIRELNKGCHHSSHLQRAWTKHGADCFRFFILEETTEQTMLTVEGDWIVRLQSHCRDFGYNICAFGTNRLGSRNSAETNAKIGNANRGQKRSAEICRMISETRKGKKLGPKSPEAIEKSAAAQRGKKRRPLTAEHREKISAANAGRCFTPREFLTDDHKAAISRSLTGKKRKPFSPEHRARIAEAARRQWDAIKAAGHSGRSVPLC